jgi:hypothetical protein
LLAYIVLWGRTEARLLTQLGTQALVRPLWSDADTTLDTEFAKITSSLVEVREEPRQEHYQTTAARPTVAIALRTTQFF